MKPKINPLSNEQKFNLIRNHYQPGTNYSFPVTIGVTSCECERSNSELGLLKTYLRATMGQERLNGLALMHVHYDLHADLDEIVNMFARRHPRKMKLESIL